MEFLNRRTEPSRYPFAWNDEEEWPREDNALSENENAMKETVKNPATITHVLVSGEQVRQTGLHEIIDANHYSTLTKLLQITAYVLYILLACASSLSIRPLDPGKLHKMFTNKSTTANAKKRKKLIPIQ